MAVFMKSFAAPVKPTVQYSVGCLSTVCFHSLVQRQTPFSDILYVNKLAQCVYSALHTESLALQRARYKLLSVWQPGCIHGNNPLPISERMDKCLLKLLASLSFSFHCAITEKRKSISIGSLHKRCPHLK